MKILLRLLVAALLLATLFVIYSFYLYRAPSVPAEAVSTIERGTGARAMLKQLHAEKLLPSPWKILLPVVVQGEYRRLQAGEYHFEAGMSPRQVISSLASGHVVVHAITIPEGLSIAQVGALLNNEPLLRGELPAVIAEGSIAPDTVHFARGDSRASVVERLQAQQQQILGEAWQDRAADLPLASPQEALILASIVEEETGLAEERSRIAAVYLNRLRLGMALQADPTVAYGINSAGMDRPLSYADLKRNTPYNTYIRKGLPPTPISNPGRASIAAVMNPSETDALYFVATGNGGHHFAATAAEHAKNVAEYRVALRARRGH